MSNRHPLNTLTLAAAFTGALSLAGAGGAAAADPGAMEKCYGISKAGENGCAHYKGLHSCAGNSTLSFEGGDWTLVPAGSCEKSNGSQKPYDGINPKLKG